MKNPIRNLFKNIITVVFIFLVLSAIFSLFSSPENKISKVSITQLAKDINDDKVQEIKVVNNIVSVLYKDQTKGETEKEPDESLSTALLNYGVDKEKIKDVSFSFQEVESVWSWLFPLLVFVVLPLVVFFYLFSTVFKQAKAGAAQTFDFTKARAKLFGAEGAPREKVNFKDVAGLKEEKAELEEVVDFLKNPQKYLKMGARIPKGVLLVGPAGCGKTLLARAVAGESNVPFFSVAGSSFVEMFVGVGSGRVRNLFAIAKKHQPCLIFIDELDSVGKTRGPAITGGHEEREQTLNQLLTEMDGFEQNDKIIVLAATNRPDVLDPALLRPGRFDRKVVINLPDIKEREDILKIHAKNKPLSNINLREVAERTPGFSGADLANVMNEAAILAAKKNNKNVIQQDLLDSIEKVLLGPERRSHVMSEKEKKIIAFHEAGHALVSAFIPNTEPVRKISIISRGMAAGYTLKVPKEDKMLRTKSEFESEIAVLLGGYVSEKLKFNDITTGASDDLNKASILARKIVKTYGMSSLGPVVFGEKEIDIFSGGEYGERRNYSENIAIEIDKEVRKIIQEGQKTAEKTITKHKKLLEKIAERLIKKETIEREEFEELIKKR